MQQYLFDLLSVVVTGVAGYVGKEAVQFLRSHQKEKWAVLAVKFVEESFKDLEGKDKFVKAADWLVGQLSRLGIKNVSNEELEGLIQSAVNELKQSV